MSGKRQLFLYGKDAHPNSAGVFCSGVSRKDECGLRQVHFSCDGLHFVVIEATTIEEDRERIALKRPRGEHVILNKGETAGRVAHSKLDSASKPEAAKFLGAEALLFH